MVSSHSTTTTHATTLVNWLWPLSVILSSSDVDFASVTLCVPIMAPWSV